MKRTLNSKLTVLVVDDEEFIREEIAEYLTLKGYKTISCEDGFKGQEAFEENDVDIIITDVKMPKCDGHTMIQKIRLQSKSVPIIALTGHYAETDLDELREEGASQTMLKPMRLNELLESFEAFFG